MNLLGIHLTLLIGPTVPVPASPLLMEALKSVEVKHSDSEHSGFQITFQVGRSGSLEMDYGLLSLLQPCNRVIMIVTFDLVPRVLMDGIITNQQLTPSNEPGSSTLTVTGEDIGVVLDMEERSMEYPGMDEGRMASMIMLRYPQYGLIPRVTQPPMIDPALPIERTPVQQCSDLQQLHRMASRHGYVFYIESGPAPFANTGYFGPPRRLDLQQTPLSVNMGPATNVEEISFGNNALGPTRVSGFVQDRQTNESMQVRSLPSTRPPLSSQPSLLLAQRCLRERRFRSQGGLSFTQSMAQAQGTSEESNDAVTVQGELDSLRYGDILQARGLVKLRGAGLSYDGLYDVKQVTHVINRGSYRQRFILQRGGIGTSIPVV